MYSGYFSGILSVEFLFLLETISLSELSKIPTGEKFSTKAQIDMDINNYFNVSDIHTDLLQAPFDKTKLRL